MTCAGALIVEDVERPPYDYDEDRIIFLSDYFNKTDDTIVSGLLADPFKWRGETNSLLINGLSGTASNQTWSCAPPSISAAPGKVYRFRFIGSTSLSLVALAIDGHSRMTIIEADGRYTMPYDTPYLQVGSGQRFSVLIKTKSAEELKATGKEQFRIQFENRERPDPMVRSYARLSYTNSSAPCSEIPSKPPLKLPLTTYDFLEYALSPLSTAEPFPTASEVSRRVIINVQQMINGTIKWIANNNSWVADKIGTPYLTHIYVQGQAAIPNYNTAITNGGWDPISYAFPAKLGEVLEIVWQNGNGPSGGWDFHPFHAHGGHYWDIGSGNVTYSPEDNEKRLQGYRPAKRDTTVLYRYAVNGVPETTAGWRAWRMRVTNPGVWMLHCHTLQHIIMGM